MPEPDIAVSPDDGIKTAGVDEADEVSGGYDDEPRYTLDEAARIIVDMACAKSGHDHQVIANDANTPLVLLCNRCKKSGTINNWKAPTQ